MIMYIYCDWLWIIWLLNAKYKTENYTDFGHFLIIYLQTIKWEITLQNTIKKYMPYAFFGRGLWRQNRFKMHQITWPNKIVKIAILYYMLCVNIHVTPNMLIKAKRWLKLHKKVRAEIKVTSLRPQIHAVFPKRQKTVSLCCNICSVSACYCSSSGWFCELYGKIKK